MISVMMREPPAEAWERYTSPEGSSTMVGEIEERGRLRGFTKLAGAGAYPNALVVLGMLKSSGIDVKKIRVKEW